MEWNDAFIAGLFGGLAVKALDIAHAELRRRFDKTEDASKFMDQQLDPVLKTADEVVGKIRALAERDFRSLTPTAPRVGPGPLNENDLFGTLYLIACFWARVELFRRRGLSIRVRSDSRGRMLQAFFRSLEARKTRLVDRLTQRAIGECMISQSEDNHIGYTEFVHRHETDPDFRRWFSPLMAILITSNDTKSRQRLLTLGVVMHAMIDALDPTHQVTKDRPGFGNKLSRKSKSHLRFQVFGLHLAFVERVEKYLR